MTDTRRIFGVVFVAMFVIGSVGLVLVTRYEQARADRLRAEALVLEQQAGRAGFPASDGLARALVALCALLVVSVTLTGLAMAVVWGMSVRAEARRWGPLPEPRAMPALAPPVVEWWHDPEHWSRVAGEDERRAVEVARW